MGPFIVDAFYGSKLPDAAGLLAAGVAAVILKATQGKDYLDPTFHDRVRSLNDGTLLLGAYHYGSHSEPGDRQADWFLSQTDAATGNGAFSDLRLALDWEPQPTHRDEELFGTMTTVDAAAFVRRVHDRTGRYPLVYGSESFLRDHLATASVDDRIALAACDLWLASWGPEPSTVRAPAPWDDWTLLQYTNGRSGPTNTARWPRVLPGCSNIDVSTASVSWRRC